MNSLKPEKQTETTDISACILFMLFMLVLNELIVHKLNYIKTKCAKLNFIQPSSLTTLLGIIFGFLLNLTNIFDIITIIKQGFSEFFLIILLPPMIYEQAINIQKSYFFKNIGSILCYSTLGTIISIFTVFICMKLLAILGSISFSNSENLAFGSLISATNPTSILYMLNAANINRDLFSLVYGESILNDAVSIILYNTSLEIKDYTGKGLVLKIIQNFLSVFFCSIFVGWLIGIFSAFSLKSQNRDSNAQENKEMTILVIVPWFSYLIAEGLKMSGIVSILFCGITMAKYTLPNVSDSGRKIHKQLYSNLAYNFQNIVFLSIGIGFVSFDLAWKEIGIFSFIFIFFVINLARFFNILIVSFILNKERKNKINKMSKLILWFSGFKGSTCYALSMKSNEKYIENDAGRIMLTVTLLYSILNIFIHSSLFQFIIDIYKENSKNSQIQNDDYPEEQQNRGFFHQLKEIFAIFDSNFLQKLLYDEDSIIEITQLNNESPVESYELEDKNDNQDIPIQNNAKNKELFNNSAKQKHFYTPNSVQSQQKIRKDYSDENNCNNNMNNHILQTPNSLNQIENIFSSKSIGGMN